MLILYLLTIYLLNLDLLTLYLLTLYLLTLYLLTLHLLTSACLGSVLYMYRYLSGIRPKFKVISNSIRIPILIIIKNSPYNNVVH